MEPKHPNEYVWWQPPWRWDWYQWVFVLAVGLWLNITVLLFSGTFADWMAKLDL